MVSGVRHNRSIDTDILSVGFARLLAAGHLQRYKLDGGLSAIRSE